MKKIIEFKNIKKEFLAGRVVANDNVSFFINAGEIHALAGENGAGKSTLLAMLFGLHKPTSGKMIVNGKLVNYNSTLDAIKDGMGMVHQHFQLVDKFTVAENVVLGIESSSMSPLKIAALKAQLATLQAQSKNKLSAKQRLRIASIKKALKVKQTTSCGFLQRQKIHQEIKRLVTKYNFNLKPNAKVATLTVGQQQKVEILKLLYRKSNILIFDEPTAMLTPEETQQLLDSLLTFKKQGKTIIIVTHKLDEIKKVADRVSVLRKGRYVATRDVEKITAQTLSKMMVGRPIDLPQLVQSKTGQAVLVVKNLTVKKHKVNKLNKLSFEVKAGQIVAIAGVEGNGQTELADAISGINRNYHGQIRINNQLLEPLTIRARNQLLSNVPEDRHKYGIITELRAYENIVFKSLSQYSQLGFLNRKKMLQAANIIINNYDVRGANYGNSLAANLSGGNQQKLVLGREFSAKRPVVLAFQATRGLDIGAINYVHNQLLEQKAEGKAVLMISYDLNEILQLADKVIVLNRGSITGVLEGVKLEAKMIGKLMSAS